MRRRPLPSPYRSAAECPASLDVYVAPGASRYLDFSTNSQLGATVKTNDGGAWLSVALDGTGSFRFSFPYRIHLAPTAAMEPATYNGLITTAGSSFAADNKAIPVTMRVTTQPIAQASTGLLHVRLAQGAPVYVTDITLTNLGQGTCIFRMPRRPAPPGSLRVLLSRRTDPGDCQAHHRSQRSLTRHLQGRNRPHLECRCLRGRARRYEQPHRAGGAGSGRSEERRVGEECRSRWS